MMRAMTTFKGEVSQAEIPKPTAGKGEVRVKVITSAINPAEERVINGDFVGRFLHAKTSPLIVGWDFAGTVDLLGDGVTGLSAGTSVWGHLPYSMKTKQGTFAEYITISQSELAIKPDAVPYHIAAAAATVTMTSLQSIRDLGRLKEGSRLMVIGAGGGVGSVAVGIGKRLGAEVTAVCSSKDVDRVKSYGADVVIDRKKSNPFDVTSRYDVIFDTPAVYSFGHVAKLLSKNGQYVTTLPGAGLITGMVRALFSSKGCNFVQVISKRADLELVGGWLADGLEAPIDSRHKIADLATALKRQTDSQRIGRVVVDVAEGW